MPDVSVDELKNMRGKPVYSSDGQKIGGVDTLYLAEDTHRPEWIGLGSGFFGSKRVVVPVSGVAMEKDGIRVPYDKDHVKASPSVDSDKISRTTEAELYRYYALPLAGGGMATDVQERTGTTQRTGTGQMDARGTQAQARGGQMRSGADDTLQLKEERINIGKEEVTTGRLRLHKYVDTRPVSEDIELRKESVRLERTPINRAINAGDFVEQELTIELHEEMPVISKDIIVTEEVRLMRETHVDHERISDQVRKERVELERDNQPQPDPRDRRR